MRWFHTPQCSRMEILQPDAVSIIVKLPLFIVGLIFRVSSTLPMGLWVGWWQTESGLEAFFSAVFIGFDKRFFVNSDG